MNDQLKAVLVVIGTSLLMALIQWAVGNTQVALLSLALIPSFFVCWGLSLLLKGRKRREIEKISLTRNDEPSTKWVAPMAG